MAIAGDFNDWAVDWRSLFTKQRSQILLEALAMLDFDLANAGTKSTFSRDGVESIIDVTFCSPGLASSLNWTVDETYKHSDHLEVHYSIDFNDSMQRVEEGATRPSQSAREWKTSHVFREALRR